MKIIKRFNDGTSLVQRAGQQPEIIKNEDVESMVSKVSIVSLDEDGFVVEGTANNITVTANTKLHVKVEDNDTVYDGIITGDTLLEWLISSALHTRPSK